jgi:hypothetical protein
MKFVPPYIPILNLDWYCGHLEFYCFNTKEKLDALHSDELKTVQLNDYSAILDFQNDTKTEVW